MRTRYVFACGDDAASMSPFDVLRAELPFLPPLIAPLPAVPSCPYIMTL